MRHRENETETDRPAQTRPSDMDDDDNGIFQDRTEIEPPRAPAEDNVLGKYRLIKLLGGGGIGRVYLAEHTELGRRVALKLLLPKHAADPIIVKRFFGEARAVNEVNHDNIVAIFDYEQTESGECYYIMELLEGETIFELLTKGRPDLPRAHRILVQLASALEAVHARGIVHRDLKPENIFLVQKGSDRDVVKLLDFGVAKLSTLNDDRFHKTATGALLGTPEYMAPEQTYGAQVDHRADIYAWGVLAYELSTGKKPFVGTSLHVLLEHQRSKIPMPPSRAAPDAEIPEALESLIVRCLAKDPKDRPQSMGEILDAMELLGVALDNLTAVHAPPVPSTNRRMVLVAILASAASFVAGALVMSRRSARRPAPAPNPPPRPEAAANEVTRIPDVTVSAGLEPEETPVPSKEEEAPSVAAEEAPKAAPKTKTRRGRGRRRRRRRTGR